MRKICLMLILVLVMIPASIGFAASSSSVDVSSIVDAVQKRYDSIESMHSEFEQILLHKESGTREHRQGMLIFKKPLLVRWETKSPSPELLIVNSKEIWNYFPDEDLAYKYSVDVVEESSNIIRVLTGQAKIKQDFDIESEGTEGGMVKIRLYPKKPTQSLIEAELWTDPQSNLIKRVRIFDFYGNENDIAFTKQDISAKSDDKLFTFVPSKSTEVEDRTKSGSVVTPLLK